MTASTNRLVAPPGHSQADPAPGQPAPAVVSQSVVSEPGAGTAAATPESQHLPGARTGRDPSRAIKRGPSRLPPEVVAATQRERLFDGLVHTVAEKGYVNARVEDICQAAGVTRPAFYALFAGKEDAFIATYKYGTSLLWTVTENAHNSGSSWPNSVRRGLRALLTTLAAVPSFATMAVVEINSVGPAAREEREKLLTRFGGFFLEAPRPQVELVSQMELITCVIGGIYANVYRHVAAGNVVRLPDLLPALTYFALVPFLGPEVAAAEVARDAAGEFEMLCAPAPKRNRQETQSA
jgi:AcrR family transcriptional regulator